MIPTVHELDVRTLPAAQRHEKIMEAFDSLGEGDAMVLITDHDPRPLYYQFRAERPATFGWIPAVEGPAEWRIEISRLKPKEEETGISAYFTRDHQEIDALFGMLRHDIERAEANPSISSEPLSSLYREFNERLERHIRWEEEVLFPAVETKVPPMAMGPGPVMRMEHEEIRRFKGIAAKHLRETPLTRSGLLRAAEMLDRTLEILSDHNMKEEKLYYPISDQVFAPDEAAKILTRCRAIL